jgi:hypothetical protein
MFFKLFHVEQFLGLRFQDKYPNYERVIIGFATAGFSLSQCKLLEITQLNPIIHHS